MNEYSNIEQKLTEFTRKFYISEVIKGVILFVSFGLFYLFITLFVEYIFWLDTGFRTALFWLFIFIEFFLLYRFLLVPLFKLYGLTKGISFKESSRIIGQHFPEVADKLLNILELKESDSNSILVLASIEQKSLRIKNVPFASAIDFKKNGKYIPLLLIPFMVVLISWVFGIQSSLQESLQRVVNHQTAYQPPAPYSFNVLNKELRTIEREPISLEISTEGSVKPEEAKIYYNNQQYYLQRNAEGNFTHTISNPVDNINFYIATDQVTSPMYLIETIKTPTIKNINLSIDYPSYLRRKKEELSNASNIVVPEGSKIKWTVQTQKTDTVAFVANQKRSFFLQKEQGAFELNKRIKDPLSYQIKSSNQELKDYESLSFSVDVIKDEFPQIEVKSNIDSITQGDATFYGQIGDDYGIQKLQLVYYESDNSNQKKKVNLPVTKENIQFFSYEFPKGWELEDGVSYELFFQVYDNDGVNGSKYKKSQIFTYRKKTKEEVEEEILNEQKNAINNLEKSILNQQKQAKSWKDIQEELQNKKNIEWNDKKKIDNLLRRQEQYENMMDRQTDKLKQSLEQNKEEDQELSEKKEELKKRVDELKKLAKQNRLLDEIQKMAEKLNKEDLIKKTKELAQQNRQRERSLERILEMTKRFYVEQKTMQIANKIDKLSKKQSDLSKKSPLDSLKQKEIEKEFDEVKKQLDELDQQNEKLKEPMNLPDVEQNKEEVQKSLNETKEEQNKKNELSSKKAQQKSAQNMKKMTQKMQQSMMQMQGESMEENADDLRRVLENLVLFSFEQEDLFEGFSDITSSHPDFGKKLKKQNVLKTHFEHIDDSLYVLSMRLPRLSTRIQNNLSSAHYNMDQALENFAQNRMYQGQSNQRYVMTASNNLADYLSNMLDNMKNAMSMQKGKGKKKSNEFSLPDLIQKQQGLSEEMKKGMQKSQQKKEGEQKGNSKGKQGQNGEDENGDLFEIYKKQVELRQMLENEMNKESDSDSPGGRPSKKTLKTMEELENEILEKGFNPEVLNKMQLLEYELLKLEEAKLQQNKDNKRKSNTNLDTFPGNRFKSIKPLKLFYNQLEILNKQSLPLQPRYKKKVRAYFSDN